MAEIDIVADLKAARGDLAGAYLRVLFRRAAAEALPELVRDNPERDETLDDWWQTIESLLHHGAFETAALALAYRIRPGADIDLEIREGMANGIVSRSTDATIYGRAYSGGEEDAKAHASSPTLALCLAAIMAARTNRSATAPADGDNSG